MVRRTWVQPKHWYVIERLKTLESMGLAEAAGSDQWLVHQDFETVLRAMQRLGDRRRQRQQCLQPVLNSELSFKPVDFVPKPPLEDFLGLGGIQSGDGSALPIERNMVTRDIFGFARLGDVLHENAFSARMTA
jgi:hypothetical protein